MLTHRNKTEEYAMASTSAQSINQKDDGTSTLATTDQVALLTQKDDLQSELECSEHSPIGLLSEYCQHDHIIRFDLQPLLMSWSGLDIVVSKQIGRASCRERVCLYV